MNFTFNQIRLVIYSLLLDWHLLSNQFPKKIHEKCEFIFRKYYTIIKHHFLHVSVHPRSSQVTLGKQNYYYGSAFGMALFQSMIVTVNNYIIPLLEPIENPTVFDAGAHLGFFSLPLASCLTHPQIYAFEPVSVTYNLLKKNIRNAPEITAFPFGFYDKKRNMDIYYNSNFLMYSSLFEERFTWDKKPHREKINLTTIDTFYRDQGISTINLLKIDTEGAEERILRGAVKTLPHVQYIFLEISLDQVNHTTFTTLMSCLSGKNYNFQLIKIISTIEHKSRLLLVNMLFTNILFNKQ